MKHFGLLCNSKCSTCTVLSITVSSAAIIMDGILPSWALITGLNNTGIRIQNCKFWPWDTRARVDGPWETAPYTAQFQWFTLCLCWFFWRWALLLHSCLQPLLPHKSIAGCGGYHKDLRITIKDFLGKCQVQPWHELTTAIRPGLHMIMMTSWATCIRASWSRS